MTGGTAGTLDSLDGVALTNGDMAIVLSEDRIIYHYKLESASGATENSPLVIAPDTNAINKRWILCSVVNENIVPIQSGSGTVGTGLNVWANVYSELFNDLVLTPQATGFTIAGGTAIRTLTVDETVSVSNKISHSLATAENDFLIGSPTPFGIFVKKTLAETKAILDYGMFEIDVFGALMPKNTVTSDPYFELDINGAVMPKAV